MVITVALAVGNTLVAEQADTTVFLPDDSEVADATDALSESFPDSAGLTNVTVLHRGVWGSEMRAWVLTRPDAAILASRVSHPLRVPPCPLLWVPNTRSWWLTCDDVGRC